MSDLDKYSDAVEKELNKFGDIHEGIKIISNIVCGIDFDVLKKELNEDDIYRYCKSVNEHMSEIGYWVQEILNDSDEDD